MKKYYNPYHKLQTSQIAKSMVTYMYDKYVVFYGTTGNKKKEGVGQREKKSFEVN